MRFLDDLIAKGIHIPPGTVVITADAVAKYLFEEMPEELSIHDDFPNIAPPFETIAVECLLRGQSRDGRSGRVLMKEIPARRMVWISQNIEVVPGMSAATVVASYIAMLVARQTHCENAQDLVTFLDDIERSQVRWVSAVHAFDEGGFDRHPFGRSAAACVLACITPEGSVLIDRNGRPVTIQTVHPAFAGTAMITEAMSYFYPYFLTLSFMHCKNVELRDIPNDQGFERRFTKWHGRPPVQYKDLNITPMQKVIRSAATEHKTGMHQALHICRGHFKDYRQRGLFGKIKGIFWWDQNLRGQESEGAIHKTYRVTPTPATPPPQAGGRG
jgi:hypothetical protein